MKFDRFDTSISILLALAIVAAIGYSAASLPGKTTVIDSRNMEKELASQARQVLLEKLFAPVTASMHEERFQEALLKLEEINARYPGEAHGFIVKGEILYRLGTPEGAAAAFVRGVKLNGDYIDKHSPVTRRNIIEKLVESSFPKTVAAFRASSGNPALKENLANLNYLKSRLAGGCE